ncbi:hypothetical protein [Piscinibacter sp. XHJ-5]|uniref:hypothetical protein n=1 Tax=Piscinibacter sp. XHJ-5 TaxID=3037797 RepID=UPI002452BD34|nr:hypothetical protein [Piscinibacter sp. XHJ-5]
MTPLAKFIAAGVFFASMNGAAADPTSALSSPTASGTPPTLKPCNVKADDAFVKARANGYRFEAERAQGEGECIVLDDYPSFIGRAGRSALECRFRGFTGIALKKDWQLTAATFDGDSFILISPSNGGPPQHPGVAPLELVLHVPENSERKVVLVSLAVLRSECSR